jgi:cytochrome oxidase Cu insertion factor (SCO1/SenC/PrrC family)
MKALGKDADRARALFITVDPERDTPAALKDYLSNFDPHLRGLAGDRAAVDAAFKAYRVYAKKIPLKDGDYTMDHNGRRLSHGQRRPLRCDIRFRYTCQGTIHAGLWKHRLSRRI